MMAFVAVSFSAAAQKGNFNVKAGLGVANWLSTDYEENCNYKLNWKVGGGFEFRVCKLIGIEPSVMLNSKGTKWEWEGKTVKFSRTANLLYLETPIMCNFHIDEKWAFGAGVYFATLVDDGGTDLYACVLVENISLATDTFWDSILHSGVRIWGSNDGISQWERYLVTDSNILIRQ